jgi:hypothetical protein
LGWWKHSKIEKKQKTEEAGHRGSAYKNLATLEEAILKKCHILSKI